MIKQELAEFFPTPKSVISRMAYAIHDVIKDHAAVILEPSAGRGDILDYIRAMRQGQHCARLYAIEANPELRYVLAQKGYDVIADDFLSYGERRYINGVVMNPPFKNGDEHLLKAWDIVAPGGRIVCLLNAATVQNPHTARRQRLKELIAQYGTVESLGQVFKHAARTTDVEVVIVVLNKPGSGNGLFDDVEFETVAQVSEESFTASEVANTNMLEALVAQHDAAARAIQERNRLDGRLAFYVRGVRTSSHAQDFVCSSINDELDKLRDLFWDYIFERTNIAALTTSKVREQFEKTRASSRRLAFTMNNLMALMFSLRDGQADIIKQCICEAFDAVTALHEKNKVHTEGWKTNKGWMINRKIIVPWGVSWDQRFNSWSTRSYRTDFFKDLDKACCFLAGRNYADMRRYYDGAQHQWITPDEHRTIADAIDHHIRDNKHNWNVEFESEFFRIRIFKKGTVHLVFRDESLWKLFNQTAADGKQWVGAGF